MIVVFALILLALVLFATEWFPVDVTAILVMVLLIVLEPWTQISPREGISGFASPATITVLAMLILSTGINRTGIVQSIGRKMSAFAGFDRRKQLAATIGVTGPISGVINNTPVVAILVPVITDLAHNGKTSPSKLLIPLSFASMLGGTLTLIGTSTNILASNIAAQIGSGSPNLGLHAFGMFEFTKLGIVVFAVGTVYLMTVGVRLLPERVPAEEDLVEEYALQEYLADVVVPANSSFIGQTVEEVFGGDELDIDVLQLIRYGERFDEPLARKEIHEKDMLRLRTNRNTLERIINAEGLSFAGSPRTEDDLHPGDEEPFFVEVVIPSGSFLVGETLTSSTFRQRYTANVLAFRTRGDVVRDRFEDIQIRVGDTLLVQAPPDSLTRLVQNEDFIVAHEFDDVDYRSEKVPFAVAIVVGVVALPALNILPIVVSALAGVVAMILTGVLKPNELYSIRRVERDLPAGGRHSARTRAPADWGRQATRESRRIDGDIPPGDRRLVGLLRRDRAVDERHQQQRERRVDDPCRGECRSVDRCERVRVRPRRDIRSLDRVHDAGRLPDEPLRLRTGRVHVLGLSPRRCPSTDTALRRDRAGDCLLLGRSPLTVAEHQNIVSHWHPRSAGENC